MSAFDSRYHELEFLSDDQKTSVWEQLENEFKEYNVIPITEINSDENKPVEPPAKKIRSLIVDSDEENEDEGNELHKYKNITEKISHNEDLLLWWKYNE